ncbi:MAG: hypothetical protein ABJF50_09205 [Paracoccaceae bacterium]
MFRAVMADYCGRVGLEPPVEAELIGRIFHAHGIALDAPLSFC